MKLNREHSEKMTAVFKQASTWQVAGFRTRVRRETKSAVDKERDGPGSARDPPLEDRLN